MSDIVLVAINARYTHTAMSLRCLRVNLPQALYPVSEILEFTIQNAATQIAYTILGRNAKIVALSVYIWNVDLMRQVAEIIKLTRPEIRLIIGGPEVAEIDRRANDKLFSLADLCIVGEGEEVFAQACQRYLLGDGQLGPHVMVAKPVNLSSMRLPYDEYSDDDLAHRILYVESGRGCPYHCAFCLSADENGVRQIDLDLLFEAFERLIARGARAFKFLDRTLNANLGRALDLMAFFQRFELPDLQLHFEMVPHRIPEALIEALAKFPPGSIQIEFGVQTLNPDVSKTISRPLDEERLLENLRLLRQKTGAHIHADLIAGLPGENFESFALGFDKLYASGVQEVQLGILKRLYGAPLDRDAEALGLIFSSHSPYEILQTPDLSFEEITEITRMAKFWDTLINNAHFPDTVALICGASIFKNFMSLSQWIYAQTDASHGISQTRWVILLFEYMTGPCQIAPESAALCIIGDYLRTRKEDIPPILRPHLPDGFKISQYKRVPDKQTRSKGHQRQERHVQLEG